MIMDRLLPALVTPLTLALLAPAVALAQSGGAVVPSSAQSQLLQEGGVALKMGDFGASAARYEEALKLGELNVAYLGLARAQLGGGRCDEASASLARVLSAPRAVNPPVSEVLKDAAALRQDMTSQCPASVIIQCSPVDMSITVDGLGPLPCDGRPLMLLPGEHVLRGERAGERVEQVVALGPMERRHVDLRLGDALLTMIPAERPERPGDPPVEVERPRKPTIDELLAEEAVEEPKEGEPEEAIPAVREVSAPPVDPVRRWMLGAQIAAIVSGDAQIEREFFDNLNEGFEQSSGEDASGVLIEIFAGYRFSRRYNLFFGPKLNVTPEFRIDTTDVNAIPTGTMTDLDFFGMLTYPINERFSLFGTLELGMSFLSSESDQDPIDGANFGGTGGLRFDLRENLSLSVALKGQAYALSNNADVFANETVLNIAGSRTLLTFGVTFAP